MTISLNLRAKPNRDGTHTLRIRVTHKRRSRFISLFPIKEKYFNKQKGRISKSHPKFSELDLLITNEQNRIATNISNLRENGLELSLDNLFKSTGSAQTLNYFLDAHMERLLSLGKLNSSRKYENLKDKINQFDSGVLIKDIDGKWIERFYYFLEQQPKINSRETVNRYIKFLKTILRKALENNQKVSAKALNYKLPKSVTFKTKLSVEELKLISKYENADLNLARDTFMLQFHARGTRISDILKLRSTDIVNGNLMFDEQKTGKKKQLEITDSIQKIISRYKGLSKFDYILPWMDMTPNKIGEYEFTKKIESKTAMVNKQLKLIAAYIGLEKKLTTHVARHSFAVICLKQNVNLGDISDLLNHSSVRSTQAYLKALVNNEELNLINNKISSLI